VLFPPYTDTARSTLLHAVCGRGPVEERGPVAGVLVAACTHKASCEWSLFGGRGQEPAVVLAQEAPDMRVGATHARTGSTSC